MTKEEAIRAAIYALDMKPGDYKSNRLISRVAFQIIKAANPKSDRLTADHIKARVNTGGY